MERPHRAPGGVTTNMTSFIENAEKRSQPQSTGRNLHPTHDSTGLLLTRQTVTPRDDGKESIVDSPKVAETSEDCTRLRKAEVREFSGEPASTVSYNIDDDTATTFSIFGISENHQKHVTLPQILTVFASPAEKNSVVEIETGNHTLPPIEESSRIQQKSHIFGKGRNNKKQLFDYREVNLQENARKKQIKLLKKRGYGTGIGSDVSSRFVAQPYEGACDDVTLAGRTLINFSKSGKKQSLPGQDKQERSAKNTSKTLSPPADEETLAKIETAFQEWTVRKLGRDAEEQFRLRKRSASHSPTRTSTPIGQSSKLTSSFSSSSHFLHHQGNLRKQPTGTEDSRKEPGRTYQAIASPALSRRRLVSTRREGSTSATVAVESTSLLRARSSGKLTPIATPQNKRLNEIRSAEGPLSSSLPDLHKGNRLTSGMDHKGHRPRTSSLKKSRNSSAGKSPQVQRKGTPKLKECGKKNDSAKGNDSNKKKKEKPSPAMPRRVVLNTSLPTASPTFQRAMKGMPLPDKDYSKIFDQSRRDSILRSYTIPESVLNSFRDDYDLTLVESSSNALEEMTSRFKDNVNIYKDGWNSTAKGDEKRQTKSILRKRRQSVDDLDIGTRKNLTKYLESKRDEGSAEKKLTFK